MKPNPNPNSPFPESLKEKLSQRGRDNALRSLQQTYKDLIDFSSNDYLGFSFNQSISELVSEKLDTYKSTHKSATGSRLLTGNYPMIEDFESYLKGYYNSEAATVFNSGYDANLGLISAIGQRQDLILYDELCHASIRDGIQLSPAKAYKFKHNDLSDLEAKLSKFKDQFDSIYVVSEYVFSMDGDDSDPEALMSLCNRFQAFFILDEAHSIGVLNRYGIDNLCFTPFARVVTFGKAFGAHGAVVLGSNELKTYLINFAKSFVYTTAPSQETTARNWASHLYLDQNAKAFETLKSIIQYFKAEVSSKHLSSCFIDSNSAIQSCVIQGNTKVKSVSKHLQKEGFDVRPILSPTVPKGKERLRFCLHSFNTKTEISEILSKLGQSITN
ncbi:aminotransferase class I/II-fold pyridoxal phosphate-dependent enzyme [Psychroflexus tropicus]|uniref:aminotransferase class I/II-fold pyridoxal phosphate-dependent enzyme n=1 Tax=Psychroflexus tropicus TaxID=197345 RepID=UPI00039F429C|nr:aminotransferase class I/II-fold pyridoxal phosphate-dependent enzyme [Psychroflexus tropicus]